MARDDAAPPRLTFLSTVPATRQDKHLALAWVVVSFVAFLVAVPYVRLPLPRITAFIPAYEAALSINDLITAVLLFGQFAQLRSRALLVLAVGYLFDAQIIVVHALTFPGVFSETGLLGAGPQTTAWIYVLWHAGFPLFVLGYAVLRGRTTDVMNGKPNLGGLVAVLATTVLTIGLAVLVTRGHDLLPVIIQGSDYSLLIRKGVSPTTWAICLGALVVLWLRSLPTTLDLWLMVTLCAWQLDVPLSAVISSHRFDLGFYAGRLYGLMAASFVLAVLLREMDRLYANLATALREAEARNADLARSREEFARVQRFEAVGQIVGGVAHDFNNLLTVVTGSLELMQRKSDDQSRMLRLSRTALEAAQRGEQLTRQLLTFARRQVLRPEIVRPNEVILQLESFMQRAIGERVQLVVDLNPALWASRLDPTEFEAALLNLVVNARDAINGVGQVSISTANVELTEANARSMPDARAGEHVMVTVSDTGTGMAPAVAARAFEPFFTTKGVGKGSGLGLSQVYGFARGAGGHAHIVSTVGAGTSVQLYLPRSREVPPPCPATSAMPGPASIEHETILVVEDEPAVLDIVVEGLRELGYAVRVARDAAEALGVLRSGLAVDVLFSDVGMPGTMNGAELAIEARRIQPDLKILLTSGYAPSSLAQDHGVPGDLDVLRKPYRRDELAQKLRLVIGA